MDGIHDLGGKQGFGAIDGTQRPVGFEARWHARVFAILRTGGLIRNSDQFRHAIERIDPIGYLTHGYYGRWLGGLETLLIEAGMVTRQEIAAAVDAKGGQGNQDVAARPEVRPDVISYLPEKPRADRAVAAAPKFDAGATVRTRATGVSGHTRLPAYARGKVGRVVDAHGGWVFPDTNAHGAGECPQHLYTVAFAGEALWGEDGEPDTEVRIDLFESYLEALE